MIGAGPVGSHLAFRLACNGYKVTLIEEHRQIGKPFQCAGMVNPETMKITGMQEAVLTDVYGARLHAPSGKAITIGGDEVVRTHVVCRKQFDEGLARKALGNGAKLMLETKPVGIKKLPDSIEVELDTHIQRKKINTRLLVGADGATSWVRRKFQFPNPKEMMKGFQVEVTGYRGQGDKIDLYTGDNYAPGLFAWAIPSGNTHRVGNWTFTHREHAANLEQLLDNLFSASNSSSRFNNLEVIGRFGGLIPTGGLDRFEDERVIVVGDAAALAKPTTGGGIGPGISMVEATIGHLQRLLSDDDLTASRLKAMNEPLYKLHKRQNRTRKLRNLFLTNATDSELEKNFEIFSRPEVLELINEKGDIEHPARLGLSLLRRVPEFRSMALKGLLETTRGDE